MLTQRRTLPSRYSWLVIALTGLVTVLLTSGLGSSHAAFTASVTNTADTVSLGYIRCADSAVALGATHYYQFASGAPTADSGTAARSMTFSGGPGFTAAGPCPYDASNQRITLNGTSQYGYVGTARTYTSGTAITMQVWFKTSTKRGLLLGYGDSTSAIGSTNKGLALIITSAGRVELASFNNNTNYELVSPNVYTDGSWHLATGVVRAGTGTQLYVDGLLVASNPAATSQSLTNVYLKMGVDNLYGWTASGHSGLQGNYWHAGDLARPAVFVGRALSAQEVMSIYRAGTHS